MRILALLILSCGWLSAQPFSLSDRALLERTSPLLNGLQGYWRLDESSGTRYDRSKNGNHLTSNNSVGQTAGVSAYTGNAATFVSASSQSLTRADNSSLSAGNYNFTISAWIFLTNKTANRTIISKWTTATPQREYILRYTQSTDRFAFFVSPDGTTTGLGTVEATTFGSPSINTWYLVVAWHDAVNDQIGIAINGGAANTAAYATGVFDGTADFEVGRQQTTVDFFDGRIDEAGFWNRVLTAAERTQLYNAGSGVTHPRFKP